MRTVSAFLEHREHPGIQRPLVQGTAVHAFTPALLRQRQAELCEPEANWVYTISSRPTGITE